jgi:Tol biopolymer transport system component
VNIEPDQTLLHYRIVDKLGEGGMGVVWRAIDTTLDREVALKVLPEALATDPERLARFEREAKLLASLNHANIAEIYGLHVVDDTRFIAMELVPGEDLARRIERGAVPEREVLEITKQIARALEAAHEQGVVHRDLKPANVQLTPDGRVKVLDFGLAKTFQQDTASSQANPSMSPTLTSLGTQAGVILGTAAYMPPEQARGHVVDKRADIWALGCLLYEMLTGRSTFAGGTISDTLAAVLKSDPDWAALPEETDPTLRLLIGRCLDKDVRQRMRDVGEARIAIEQILGGSASGAVAVGATLPPTLAAGAGDGEVASAARTGPGWLRTAVLVVLVAAITALASWWINHSTGTPAPVVRRFDIVAPGLRANISRAPKLSPDGRRVAYIADERIWVRDLDQLTPREVPGSEGGRNIMWSPDGDHVGWQAGNNIWRAAVAGGAKTAICDSPPETVSAVWGPGDRIILTPDIGPLYEVSARGGDPQALLAPIEGQDEDFHTPSFLPGRRGLVYTLHRLDHVNPDTIEVLVNGERKVVLQIEDHGLVLPQVTESGYLVYQRYGGNSGLWAAPFSLERLELTGDPILIDPEGRLPSVSSDGSLLYFRSTQAAERQLVWVDREGREEDTIGQPQADLTWPALSADGLRVAVAANSGDSTDIWVHDRVRGSRMRLTFESEDDWAPAWYPDGTRVALGRSFRSTGHILSVAADGGGDTTELAAGWIADVSADGQTVVFEHDSPETGDDLFYVDGSPDAEPTLFLGTPQGEEHVQFSPKGDYVAYTSSDSGRDEIYLKQFPSGDGRWQISVDGGNWSRWSPAGGELFYLQEDRLMVVDIELGDSPRLGTPRELFSLTENGLLADASRPYDVAPDGNHFVMMSDVNGVTGDPKLTFVENWVQALK